MLPPIKVLLVDDEFLALELLSQYISQIPQLQIIGKAQTGLEALEYLHSGQVDLLFLDIQMPGLSGVGLLKTLSAAPVTIFTTAYDSYAIEAFDLNAVDYLLKPFSFERFIQAVNKARVHLQPSPPHISEVTDHTSALPEPLVVKVDGNWIKIPIDQILFVEGLREYVRIVTPHQKWVTLESLKNLEDALAAAHFLRVHKSYLVAKKHVEALQGNQLKIGEHLLPISRAKREWVLKTIFGQEG